MVSTHIMYRVSETTLLQMFPKDYDCKFKNATILNKIAKIEFLNYKLIRNEEKFISTNKYMYLNRVLLFVFQ